MSLQRWAPRGPRIYHALIPAPTCAWSVFAVVVWREPVFVAYAVVSFVLTVRALRLELVLDADHAVVRNPLRTYRVRYADVYCVEDDPLVLFGNAHRTWWSTPRVSLLDENFGGVTAAATAWLPPAEYRAVRTTLADLVRAHAPPEDDLDTSPPYTAVLALLEEADPAGVYPDADPDVYAYDADEVAAVLRERDVTAEEIAELFDEPVDESLAARLNALRA